MNDFDSLGTEFGELEKLGQSDTWRESSLLRYIQGKQRPPTVVTVENEAWFLLDSASEHDCEHCSN